jgi:putative NIF3 family GTP cyclohydrolase 1 type 2
MGRRLSGGQYTAIMHANASLTEMVAWLDEQLDATKYAAAEPDSNGLLYASPSGDGVSKFAVAVNTSLTTIVGAAKSGANLLVVHHASWAGIDLHLREEKLAALEASGVSLYGAHASLDCARHGTGWALAELLGVSVEGTFGEFAGGHAGVIGGCGGSFAELIQRASKELRVEVEAHQHAKTFGRVAIMTGAGGMTTDLDAARQLGADTYVTGEGSMFTRLFAREIGMNLVFGTHQATEAPGVRALGQRLGDEAGIPWEFIDESLDVF